MKIYRGLSAVEVKQQPAEPLPTPPRSKRQKTYRKSGKTPCDTSRTAFYNSAKKMAKNALPRISFAKYLRKNYN